MNRTGSIGSRVPPADTTTRTPVEVAVPRPVRPRSEARPSRPSTVATISAGSASRPVPTSPPARRPSSGGTTVTPR